MPITRDDIVENEEEPKILMALGSRCSNHRTADLLLREISTDLYC